MLVKSVPNRSAEYSPAALPAPMDLNLFPVFAEIAHTGSISLTAERLHIPKATLSRKLRQLEQQIGAVLLKRSLHGLELTDVGRALMAHCQRIATEASEAQAIVAEMQSQLSGTMHISIPFGLSNTWVSHALARFASQYPDLKLAIDVTNRWVDVSEEPYDVALHIGCVRNQGLPSRRLAELGRGFYASPEYLEQRGVPDGTQDLVAHDCIALETQLADEIWTFPDSDGADSYTVSPRMTATDIVIAREMAVAGIGIAILTHVMCAADVKDGRLARILTHAPVPPVTISATFLERRHLPRRVRAFIDLIAQAIRDHSTVG
jgi:DNA-binding transcriptional LysR family regulator